MLLFHLKRAKTLPSLPVLVPLATSRAVYILVRCVPLHHILTFFFLISFFNEVVVFFYKFIYLWLCWVIVSVWGLSLVAASGGHSSSWCAGLSLSRPLLLQSTGSRRAGSVVVAQGLSCSAACGIFPNQGSNPCPLHWQADSQPLRHQGRPYTYFLQGIGMRTFSMWFLLIFLSRISCNKRTATGTTKVSNHSLPLFTHQNSKQSISRDVEINGGNFSLMVHHLLPGSCHLGQFCYLVFFFPITSHSFLKST